MKTHCHVAAAVLAALLACAAAPPAGAQPDTSHGVAQFLTRFGFLCLSDPPDFDTIGGKASFSGYHGSLHQEGQHKQTHWSITDASVPMLLIVDDVTVGTTHVVSCTVTALGLKGEDAEQALSGDPQLGQPTAHGPGDAPGSVKTTWTVAFDPPLESLQSQAVLQYEPNTPGDISMTLFFATPVAP